MMTGTQKIKQFNELSTTTRQILGTTSVPAAKLRNLDLKTGTATVIVDGLAYEAILWSQKAGFKLTGNYETI